MIETVYGNDRNGIIGILSSNPELSLNDARFCIEKSDSVIVYKNNSLDIVGCGTLRLWGEDRKKADVYIYVMPGARNSGVGGMLLKSLTDATERRALEFISTKIETNHLPTLDFFHKIGFKKWYTELILCHSGERQPESNLELTNYQSQYFEQYVEAIRNSFLELRTSNDFQPYHCCEPDEAKRNELEQNKDKIFVLLDGGKLAASVIVNTDSIEDLFVTPDYQGKGLGNKMMNFALNKAIDNGNSHVKLSVIEWNSRALHLYESVGFRIVKTIHYLRLF